MKKILAGLIILAFCIIPATADQDLLAVIARKKASVGASCSASTDEVGNRNVEATGSTLAPGYTYLNLHTADCTGTLNTIYFYYNYTEDVNFRLAIYADDGDSIPYIGDTLVAVSAVMNTGSSIGWKSASLNTGSVTQGQQYWFAVFIQAAGNNLYGLRSTTGSARYSMSSSGHYTTPPANLDGTWTSTGTGEKSEYASIGD
jgi:hypothetical protein